MVGRGEAGPGVAEQLKASKESKVKKKKAEQPTAPLLISVQEAADMLGFSKRWLETRIRNGEVPSLRTGPSVRMRRSDVETFVKTGKWPKP